MRPPSWWRDEYSSNALLYACAYQQLTAEETLYRQVQQYNDLFKRVQQMMAHATPIVIVKKDE